MGFKEGDVIADRYRLVRVIGSGGMGTVWRAEHNALKTPLAIKLIDADLMNRAELRARFLREAQLAARIQSEHVVKVFDHGVTSNNQPFIAMELLSGQSVRDRLVERGRLSLARTARIVRHVGRALTRAHEEGLVHRDLKPDNLFIVTNDGDDVIKVLDFGAAKAPDALAVDGVDPTRTGTLMGTPYYMSPEQALGLKDVDARADLWSLGVVVFECLTGRHPFTGAALGPLINNIVSGPIPVPSRVAPDANIPPAVDTWMTRALERERSKRFSTAKEAADAFLIASGMAPSEPSSTSSSDVIPAMPMAPVAGPGAFADTVASEPAIPVATIADAQVSPSAPAPAPTPAPAPAPRTVPLLAVIVVAAALVIGITLLVLLH